MFRKKAKESKSPQTTSEPNASRDSLPANSQDCTAQESPSCKDDNREIAKDAQVLAANVKPLIDLRSDPLEFDVPASSFSSSIAPKSDGSQVKASMEEADRKKEDPFLESSLVEETFEAKIPSSPVVAESNPSLNAIPYVELSSANAATQALPSFDAPSLAGQAAPHQTQPYPTTSSLTPGTIPQMATTASGMPLYADGFASYNQTPHNQQPPFSQSPYAQAPQHQAPYAQPTYGQTPYPQTSHTQAPYAQASYAQTPYATGMPRHMPEPFGQPIPGTYATNQPTGPIYAGQQHLPTAPSTIDPTGFRSVPHGYQSCPVQPTSSFSYAPQSSMPANSVYPTTQQRPYPQSMPYPQPVPYPSQQLRPSQNPSDGQPRSPYFEERESSMPIIPDMPKKRRWPWVLLVIVSLIAVFVIGTALGTSYGNALLDKLFPGSNSDQQQVLDKDAASAPAQTGSSMQNSASAADATDYPDVSNFLSSFNGATTLEEIQAVCEQSGFQSSCIDDTCTPGMYTVGDTLAPGEYFLEGDSVNESCYLVFTQSSSDSSKYVSSKSISYFGHYFATFKAGDVVVFCSAGAKKMYPSSKALIETGSTLQSGVYRVGTDIPAGTYELTADDSADRISGPAAYIMKDMNFSEGSILKTIMLDSGNEHTVTVESGQWLELYAATATHVQ